MSGDGEGDIGGGMASGRSTRRSAKAPMAVMAHRVEVSMINRYTNDAHVSRSHCCCAEESVQGREHRALRQCRQTSPHEHAAFPSAYAMMKRMAVRAAVTMVLRASIW